MDTQLNPLRGSLAQQRSMLLRIPQTKVEVAAHVHVAKAKARVHTGMDRRAVNVTLVQCPRRGKDVTVPGAVDGHAGQQGPASLFALEENPPHPAIHAHRSNRPAVEEHVPPGLAHQVVQHACKHFRVNSGCPGHHAAVRTGADTPVCHSVGIPRAP